MTELYDWGTKPKLVKSFMYDDFPAICTEHGAIPEWTLVTALIALICCPLFAGNLNTLQISFRTIKKQKILQYLKRAETLHRYI